jgi:restriction endonuclease S subunit
VKHPELYLEILKEYNAKQKRKAKERKIQEELKKLDESSESDDMTNKNLFDKMFPLAKKKNKTMTS